MFISALVASGNAQDWSKFVFLFSRDGLGKECVADNGFNSDSNTGRMEYAFNRPALSQNEVAFMAAFDDLGQIWRLPLGEKRRLLTEKISGFKEDMIRAAWTFAKVDNAHRRKGPRVFVQEETEFYENILTFLLLVAERMNEIGDGAKKLKQHCYDFHYDPFTRCLMIARRTRGLRGWLLMRRRGPYALHIGSFGILP